MSTEHLYPSGAEWIRPEDLKDPEPEPPCLWCGGTGDYSGSMLGRHYAGPCLVCEPHDHADSEPQDRSDIP